MSLFRIGIIITTIFLAGCASTTKYQTPSGINSNELAELTIYRTKTLFHSANPERPFFFIDEKLAGKLGTGMALTTKVRPGKHTISVRESILFMPGIESERIEHNFEAGKHYFLRYSLDFSGLMPAANTIVATGSTSFFFVDEALYQQRE